jgi:hypothetical protein
MSKRPIAAIAFGLRCACGSTRRCAQIPAAGLVVAVLAAGCGGSASITNTTKAAQSPTRTSTADAPAGWSGMGAPLSAFETAHSPQTSPGACPQGGCYGNDVFPAYVGQGQCCEFVDLSTTGPPDNRVDGYTQAFPVGTSVALAMNLVRILMPSDTTTTAFFIHHDSTGHTCAIWNVQSHTLGEWFSAKQVGDGRGVMSIDLNTTNTQQVFSAKNVTQAVIRTGAAGHRTNC